MKALLLLFTLCIAPLAPQTAVAQETKNEDVTVYYCIRHAEKDRSNPANKNPSLTSQGQQRAQKWAKVFENVSFDAVYSTDYNRTRQTASPTAEAQGLKLKSYNPRDLYNESFQSCTKGQTVLVVGHSNTTPEFVNKVLDQEKFPWIDDTNNGMLFIVTKKGETATVQVLQID